MKYCEQTTREHEINKLTNNSCFMSINCIIEKDLKGDKSFSIFDENIIAIDTDKAEEVIAKSEGRNQNKSMDMCFGLTEQDAKYILLVELKLGYKKENSKILDELNKLNANQFINKVKDSKNILGDSIPIIEEYFFRFESSIINRVMQRIKSITSNAPELRRNYKIATIQELKERWF